jgi:hypothetical protein
MKRGNDDAHGDTSSGDDVPPVILPILRLGRNNRADKRDTRKKKQK